MYTLIVGTEEWSSWSLRPYMALMATDAKFKLQVIKLRQAESPKTILKHSPSGRVPVLKFAGQTVWDSLAICETLAERHPKAGLWPRNAALRAKARSYAAEMHSSFPDVRNQLSMEFSRTIPTPNLKPETKKQITRIIAAWEEALKNHGGRDGFLFGKFSIADCMYAPVVSRFTTYGVKTPKRVKSYMDKIWQLPAMQNWLVASRKELERGTPRYPG